MNASPLSDSPPRLAGGLAVLWVLLSSCLPAEQARESFWTPGVLKLSPVPELMTEAEQVANEWREAAPSLRVTVGSGGVPVTLSADLVSYLHVDAEGVETQRTACGLTVVSRWSDTKQVIEVLEIQISSHVTCPSVLYTLIHESVHGLIPDVDISYHARDGVFSAYPNYGLRVFVDPPAVEAVCEIRGC